jgi:hypothetical protein
MGFGGLPTAHDPSYQQMGEPHGSSKVATELANGPLVEQTQDLLAKYPAARVVDARRPKFGNDLDPLTADQPDTGNSKWAISGSVTCLGLAMVLAAE